MAALLGLLAMARPVRWLLLPTRRRAAASVVAGVALVFGAWVTLPAAQSHTGADLALDEFAPQFQFRERHETTIRAAPERVFDAVKSVTADEIALFQTFTAIRRLGRPGPESILNAPGQQPILDVATRTGFLLLADRPPREVVIGTLVVAPPGFRRADVPTPDLYRALSQPGFAKAAMNFYVEPAGGALSRLSTETRVFATSREALSMFTPYWRAIFPGSAILRITWLSAVKARAERNRS